MTHHEPVRYALAHPITHQGREYTEFHVRRIKVSDMERKARQRLEGVELDISLLVDLTETPVEVIRQLDASDFVELQDIMRNFMKRPGVPDAA